MILKTFAAWGEAGACTYGTTKEYGWVRCRTEDGACWLFIGNGKDHPETIEFPKGIKAFCSAVMTRKSIDTRYWRQETGPRARRPATSPSTSTPTAIRRLTGGGGIGYNDPHLAAPRVTHALLPLLLRFR